MANILVTGGAGFIGSNFIRYILNHENDVKIINIDKLTYAGNLKNLSDIENSPNYKFYKIDICEYEQIKEICENEKIDCIINFAAESHVDRSILDSKPFLQTNVYGTLNLLEIAKQLSIERFIQVSTDEVYGSLGKEGKFTEETSLAANSPYSASKASADLFVRAYHHTFGMNTIITRCSNNYGPFQFPEKLIPLMISNSLENKKLPVYGDGMNVRDWLYVEDHCSAIWVVYKKGRAGEVYNIGGNNEKANIEIVKLILEKLNKSEDLIEYVKDRPGHDQRYAIDNSKISKELGWEPKYSFEQGIELTINWYLNNKSWLEQIKNGEYLEYYNLQYKHR